MNWRLLILAIAASLIILCSCNEQKRCARYVARHPKCFSTDTVWRYDTLKGFQVDTVFYGDTIRNTDTFTLIKDGVSVKTVVQWRDRIIQQQVTKRDTIIKSYDVYIDKPVFKEVPTLFWWAKWLLGGLLGIILLLAIGRVKK